VCWASYACPNQWNWILIHRLLLLLLRSIRQL
jgi:hypothetical protein